MEVSQISRIIKEKFMYTRFKDVIKITYSELDIENPTPAYTESSLFQLHPRAMESQKMRGNYSELLLILGLLCIGTRIGFGLNLGDSEVRCIEEDRQALLKFKQGLKDHLGLLSS